MDKDNVLTVTDFSFSYPGKDVLKNVSFNVSKGVMLSVVGPNGSGKTTLLNAIYDARLKSSKEIIWNVDKDKIFKVSQFSNINFNFPINVKEFLSLALVSDRSLFSFLNFKPSKSFHKLVKDFNLSSLLYSNLSDLSGGELQKVLICASLLFDPKVLILDEPFNNIDSRYIKEISNILTNFTRAGGTVLMVNHDWQIVKTYSDVGLLLNGSVLTTGLVSKVMTDENYKLLYFS